MYRSTYANKTVEVSFTDLEETKGKNYISNEKSALDFEKVIFYKECVIHEVRSILG